MPKSREIKVKQELVDEVSKELKKGESISLSKFVSKAIQLRLDSLNEKRTLQRLMHPRIIGMRQYTCVHKFVHNIKVAKYEDSSIWVMCPMFGWYATSNFDEQLKLGCKDKKKRCTWFVG